MENRGPDQWESLLHPVLMAYRSSVHKGTGFTPFFLWHGREMRLPVDLMFPVPEQKYMATSDFAIKIIDEIKSAYEQVNAHFESISIREENIYSSRPQIREFNVGDEILYFSPYRKEGITKKLHLHFTGPWKIITKISSILYEILAIGDGKSSQPILATNDRMRPYDKNKRLGPTVQVTVPFVIVDSDQAVDDELCRSVSIREVLDDENDDDDRKSASLQNDRKSTSLQDNPTVGAPHANILHSTPYSSVDLRDSTTGTQSRARRGEVSHNTSDTYKEEKSFVNQSNLNIIQPERLASYLPPLAADCISSQKRQRESPSPTSNMHQPNRVRPRLDLLPACVLEEVPPSSPPVVVDRPVSSSSSDEDLDISSISLSPIDRL